MNHFRCIGLLVCLNICFFQTTFAGNYDDDKEIGAILTTSAHWGKGQMHAINLWVKVFNEEGGFRAKNKKLMVIIRDDQGKPEEALKTAQKLVLESKIRSLIGPSQAASFQTIKSFANYHKVPVLAMTSSEIDPVSKPNWAFNLGPTIAAAVESIYNHLNKLTLTKIALITDGTYSGLTGSKILSDKASKMNLEIVSDFAVPIGTIDFAPLLVQLKSREPQAAVAWLEPRLYPPLVKQWHSYGIKAPLYLNQFGAIFEPEVLVDGVRVPLPPWMMVNELSNSNIKKQSVRFLELYTKEYGYKPDLFAGYAWDASRIMVRAMEVDCTEDSGRIRDALADTKDYPGINGRIEITDKNLVGLGPEDLMIAEIRNGKYIFSK
jgi:branched-chain amino acid transport system substrate-binding protein